MNFGKRTFCITKFDHINVPTSAIHTHHEDVSKRLFLYNALQEQNSPNHVQRINLISVEESHICGHAIYVAHPPLHLHLPIHPSPSLTLRLAFHLNALEMKMNDDITPNEQSSSMKSSWSCVNSVLFSLNLCR